MISLLDMHEFTTLLQLRKNLPPTTISLILTIFTVDDAIANLRFISDAVGVIAHYSAGRTGLGY
jgi:hypothetical protein